MVNWKKVKEIKMDFSKCPIIIHGSEDSLDVDAYMIVPRPLEKKEGQDLAKKYPELNLSCLVVEDRRVTWSEKGIADECNNSLWKTYHLHKQEFPMPIDGMIPRQYAVKMLHTVRGLLTHCSRTQYRDDVKAAISSEVFEDKVAVLEKIDLKSIVDFDKKTRIETYKFMAFQLGQCYSLLKDHQEVFTKKKVSQRFPELRAYLYREEAPLDGLQTIWNEFTELLKEKCKPIKGHPLYVSDFGNGKEVWHAKKEVILPPVAIFDIDGTLMDESHRAYLREGEKADWNAYFQACDKDTPIQCVVDLAKEYKAKGYEIWLMTGRSEIVKEKTIKSLEDAGVPYDHLKMRGAENKLKDFILKPIWVNKYVGAERVEVIFDDRGPVIEGLRKKGHNVVDINEFINSAGKLPESNAVPSFLKKRTM